MPKRSAGLLLYRRTRPDPEVLLVHPGGPFWIRKDDGAWTIPKGLIEGDESPLAAAKREFKEETGFLPRGPFIELGSFKQPQQQIDICLGGGRRFRSAPPQMQFFFDGVATEVGPICKNFPRWIERRGSRPAKPRARLPRASFRSSKNYFVSWMPKAAGGQTFHVPDGNSRFSPSDSDASTL